MQRDLDLSHDAVSPTATGHEISMADALAPMAEGLAPVAPPGAGPGPTKLERTGRRRRELLLFSPPTVGEEEIAEVVDTLRSGWITTGPKTHRFEAEFSARLGAPAALALSSCTAGLHLALIATGIGPGDEVITTPVTFASTANVIEHVGARPVLADVDEDTLNLSVDAVERAITPRTRAIIPVHYAGHPADLDGLQALAGPRGIRIIEDAAHAFPASYKGRRIGEGANPVSFSFYATKNLTTAEGGMLTGDPELIERARVLSLHGLSRDAWRRYGKGGNWRYEVLSPGYKYNMTDIQASIGLVQLRRVENFQRRRLAVVRAYSAAFSSYPELEPPRARAEVDPAWHLYVLRLRPEMLQITRDRFIEELALRNIATSVHFTPLHLHPFYRGKYGFRRDEFPVAEASYRRMLSLPLHPGLTDDDVADVIDAVIDVVRTFRR